MKTIAILLVIFAMLQVVDGLLTYRIIREQRGTEWMPIMRGVMSALGVGWGLLVWKTIFSVIVSVAATLFPSTRMMLCLIAVDIVYLWVVYHNYRIYYEEEP